MVHSEGILFNLNTEDDKYLIIFGRHFEMYAEIKSLEYESNFRII